jgi:hypothetical protein
VALADEVKSRFGGTSSQVLVNLTRNFNPDGLGTIDDTVLGLAVDDVKSDFETLAGVEYDDDPSTNPDDYKKHIACGVRCVLIALQLNTSKNTEKAVKWLTERYEKLLVNLSKVTSRDRFFVLTDSPYQPSDQGINGPILPDFDDDLFSFFIPGAGLGINGSKNPLTNP